jgi:hypothetical protein
MVTIVLGELVDATLRRPGAALAGSLLAIVVAGVFALGAGSHLPVLGSIAAEGGQAPEESVELVVLVTGREPVDSPAYETTLDVLTTGLESSPDVAAVRAGPVGRDGTTTALGVVLAGDAAVDRERAAERVLGEIDPGQLRLLLGGEAAVAVELRGRVEDDLVLPALAAPAAIALLLWLAGGWRLAAGGALSVAAGVVGGTALLRLLSGALELSAAGLAVAAVVGTVVGVEAAASLQLRIRQRARSQALGAAIRGSAPAASRLATASLVAAAASLGAFAIDVPAARAAAIGSVGAALAATAASLIVVPAVLELAPPRWTPRARRRRRGSATSRSGRALAAVFMAVALAGLAALAAPAVGSDPVAFDATDLEPPGAASDAYDLARAQLPQPFGAGLGAAFAPLVPGDLLARIAISFGIAALVVALSSMRWSRAPVRTVALGLSAALPAAACVGVYGLLWRRPNATMMVCAGAAVLAVSAYRSASAAALLARGGEGRGRVRRVSRATIPPATLASGAGLLACGALWWALFPPLEDLAIIITIGLAADLLAVRALALPALARARA